MEIGLRLNIEDGLINNLYKEGMKHYPNEFGGLLIGNYSEDFKTVNIKETILPKQYKSSRYKFERGKTGVFEKLTEYYNQNPKLIYVGEWHTHPDNEAIPSSTDINALKEIANHPDVKISNPLMLIMGISREKYELGFYVHFKNKLYRYEECKSASN